MTPTIKGKSERRAVGWTLIWLLLLLLWLFFYDEAVAAAKALLPFRGRLLMRTPLHVLALQHLLLACSATAGAVLTGLGLSVLARMLRHRELESMLLAIASIGETLPSAAIIALSVPLLGYGNGPVLLALYLYGILPVLRNCITGFRHLPEEVLLAAEGMGMSKGQQLWQVELPLVLPLLFAGLRMALIVNVSAATIGATVGAGGLGVPIMAGIRTRDFVTLIQGSGAVLFMALWTDSLVAAMEAILLRRFGTKRQGDDLHAFNT